MKRKVYSGSYRVTVVLTALILLTGCGSAVRSRETSAAGEEEMSRQETVMTLSEGEKIAYDEDGLSYVANQLLLFAYPGTDPELISQLAEEIGADVVDVIPEIQSYQLEFRQEKTCSELEEYKDFFLVRPFIMDADLNYVSGEVQPQAGEGEGNE